MSYEEFLEYIKEHLAEHFVLRKQEMQGDKASIDKDEYEVEVHKTSKNNGIILDGVTIRKKGEKVSPNIYLNNYYDCYKMGKPLSLILEEILDQYERVKVENVPEVDNVLDFDTVRDKIIVRLVNYEKNEEQLRNCPHLKYLDLAITFRYVAGVDSAGMASSLITNEEYGGWDIGQEDLYRIALDNTVRYFPWQMDSLTNVILNAIKAKDPGLLPKEIIEDVNEIDKMEGSIVMYVLTNNMGINGATCVLYEDVLRNFAKVHDSNVYLLPSSLHEMILVVDNDDIDPVFLQELVRDANCSAVGMIDLLSDNIYYYDREEDEVRIYDRVA